MKQLSIPFWQQKGIPKNCRKAKISGRCPIFPKPNASHFYSVKRSSVFYAKIGPRLSPKLFAMRDFLTACELCSGIIPRFPERLFAVRDSLRRVDCSRGLSAATLPRKIVCRAGFPDGLWIVFGDHRPPRSPEDCLPCGIPCGVCIAVGDYRPPRSPKIVCRAGFFAACGLCSGIIGRVRKLRRKTLFLRHGRRGKGCFTPAAAAVRTPNRFFHGCTMLKFSFRALSLQYTERH